MFFYPSRFCNSYDPMTFIEYDLDFDFLVLIQP